MSVSASYAIVLTASETVSLGLPFGSESPSVIHGWNTGGTLTGTTTDEEVSKVFSANLSLTAGAATVDLTAAPWLTPSGGSPVTVTMSTLAVRCFKLRAKDTNTGTVVVKVGATNGYDLFGDASGRITLAPGAEAIYKGGADPNSLPTVDGTHKTIDLTSTDLDAQLDIVLVAG